LIILFFFQSLKIFCPKELKRDTALYLVIRAMWNGSSPSLKNLAFFVFGIQIQDGIHDSVMILHIFFDRTKVTVIT